MTKKFTLKEFNGKRFHGSYSRTPLEIRGTFHLQGPQPIGEGGVPEYIAEIFEKLPELENIALSYKTGGVIWTRMSEVDNED